MQPQGRGAIVSLASTAGVTGGLGPHVYTMAKHGVIGLMATLERDLRARESPVTASVTRSMTRRSGVPSSVG